MSVLALSVRRWWAWSIFELPDALWKCVENRDWFTEYRGPVLIHSSKTGTNIEYNEAVFSILGETHELGRNELIRIPTKSEMPSGGIVGAVDIVDVIKGHAPWRNRANYGFVLANRRKCQFVPCRGQERFFRPPAEVVEQLRLGR